MKIKLKIDVPPFKKGEIVDAVACGTDWLVGCPTAKIKMPDDNLSSHIGEYYEYELATEGKKDE